MVTSRESSRVAQRLRLPTRAAVELAVALAANSYNMYLVHYVFVMTLPLLLSAWGDPALVKFGIVALATILLSYGVSTGSCVVVRAKLSYTWHMETPFLQTKLYISTARPELVPRPRLIEQLNASFLAGQKLTLVSAPARLGIPAPHRRCK
jgi:peptidoglycan/LPS O-acetylase OafA/YrhL